MTDIATRTQEIYDELRKLNAELDELRSKCSHSRTEVTMYSWRIGAYTPSVICQDCGSVVGSPQTAEEKAQADKIWADWNKPAKVYTSVTFNNGTAINGTD